MLTDQVYKPGDPRRVVALAEAAPEQPPSELLWGSEDPAESLRMSKIIVNGGWLALTLNEEGAGSFTYLKGALAGVREVYYISHFGMGVSLKFPVLFGQFLFDFEGCPGEALSLRPRLKNSVYFRMDGCQDYRVAAYDFLTDAEIEGTRSRLLALAEREVDYRATIDMLLEHLNR